MTARKGVCRPGSPVGPWLAYDCNTYHYSNHTKCSCHYIRQEVIMDSVRDLLNQQVLIAVDVDAMLTALQNRQSTNAYLKQAQERYRGILNRRKKQDAKIDQLLIDLTARIIDRGTYEYAKKKYEAELEAILAQETQALEDRNAVSTTVSASMEWVNALYKYRELPEITKELLDTLVDRIEVMDSHNIRVILRYSDPYANLEHLLQRMEDVRHAV